MPLDEIDYSGGADTHFDADDKTNLAIQKINEIDDNLTGGTAKQVLKKTDGTDYNYDWQDIVPSISSKGKKTVRVNAGGTDIEAIALVDVGQIEINATRTEASGSPHIDTEATIFTITTPNDGVTRDYHILLTSVIDASTGDPFRYNSYFKIAASYLSSNVAEIPTGSRITYTHNAVLSAVPPNTAILIRDKRTVLTTGTVNMSKLTYMGFAN